MQLVVFSQGDMANDGLIRSQKKFFNLFANSWSWGTLRYSRNSMLSVIAIYQITTDEISSCHVDEQCDIIINLAMVKVCVHDGLFIPYIMHKTWYMWESISSLAMPIRVPFLWVFIYFYGQWALHFGYGANYILCILCTK